MKIGKVAPALAGALLLGTFGLAAGPAPALASATTTTAVVATGDHHGDNYEDGYRDGFRDGWRAARDDCDYHRGGFRHHSGSHDAYARGYDRGFQRGYAKGVREYCDN